MKKIGLYPNEKRDVGLEGTREVLRALEGKNLEFFAPLAFREVLGKEANLTFVCRKLYQGEFQREGLADEINNGIYRN